MAVIAAGCLLLAGLSLLVPSAPTTDPWGWIVWGREVLHLDLSTVVPGAPNWKPLPVLATAPLSLAGGAAPSLWLLVARVGGLASLVVAYRLADRLGGRWAGPLAVLGLVLSSGWLRAFAHGYSEPLAIGLLIAAVDQHLSGRPRRALLLGAAVALARPEAWVLMALYGGLLVWRRQAPARLVAGLALAVAALWVVPDWIGSGDPLHAHSVSRGIGASGPGATLTALGEAALFVPVPLSVAALAGVAIAAYRGDRAFLDVAALVGIWTALLAILMFVGYPASSRFFALPCGLVCVLGAAGATCVLRAVSGRRARVALALGLALVAAPPLVRRAEATVDEGRATVTRARLEADLRTAVERGQVPLRADGSPLYPDGLDWAKGAIAWDLNLPLRRVRGVPTSDRAYVGRLSHRVSPPLLRQPLPVSITPPTPGQRFVLVSPFGPAPVRVVGWPGRRLVTVASAGRWRVQVLSTRLLHDPRRE